MPILLALAAFLMTLLGGLVAARVGPRRHLVLGAAAGVMLGVVPFDLLPEALAHDELRVFGVPLPMPMFALAFLSIHIAERSMAMHDAHETDYATHRHAHAGVGLTAGAALVVHSLLDGAAMGAAYQTDASLAAAVATGVIAHDFTDGFNTYTVTSLYATPAAAPSPSSSWTPWPPDRRHPDHPHHHPGRHPERLPGPFRQLSPLPGHLRYPPRGPHTPPIHRLDHGGYGLGDAVHVGCDRADRLTRRKRVRDMSPDHAQ
ncbi:ZIP family metal transporter [Nonomuraea sp. NPDC050153]|uniref:ZIP family metal transporter n=1 Tax=Nonomuraea sp. NPDC050153 TaxID=3364359 RepID=UPI00378E5333